MQLTGVCSAVVALMITAAMPLPAQSDAARSLERAQAQIAAAEKAEAALYAPELLRSARERYDAARLNATASKEALRQDSQRRAVEALEAATTAERIARYAADVREANRLRADVLRLGGTVDMPVVVEVPLGTIVTHADAAAQVAAAKASLESALKAGARQQQPSQFEEVLKVYDTAESLAKNKAQRDAAAHLAFLVDMRARRLEAETRASAATARLPELRLASAKLGREASERVAAEERRRREEAERQARIATAEAEQARQQATEQARMAAEQAERARLEAERQAAAARAEAQAAQAELDARARAEAEQKQRLADLEAKLAEIADTRRDDRGLVVTLPGIYFDTGKSLLKPGAREALNRIAAQLKASGAPLTVRIIGHTDSVGASDYNQRLSMERARAVQQFLGGAGLDAAAMLVEGRGEDAPVASNDTAAGRQQNRRVELIFAQQM